MKNLVTKEAHWGLYRLLLKEELSHISTWAELQYPTIIITWIDLNHIALKESY